MLYEIDAAGAESADPIEVRLFPGGPKHTMQPVPVARIMEVTAIVTGIEARPENTVLIEEGVLLMDALRASFPTADKSGELDRIMPEQLFKLLYLIAHGSLPDSLGSRTAEGNGCTAAADRSPSPSPGTPARSGKTRRRSAAASKTATSP